MTGLFNVKSVSRFCSTLHLMPQEGGTFLVSVCSFYNHHVAPLYVSFAHQGLMTHASLAYPTLACLRELAEKSLVPNTLFDSYPFHFVYALQRNASIQSTLLSRFYTTTLFNLYGLTFQSNSCVDMIINTV